MRQAKRLLHLIVPVLQEWLLLLLGGTHSVTIVLLGVSVETRLFCYVAKAEHLDPIV